MIYILAEYKNGLKIPRIVSKEEAQRAYDIVCAKDGMNNPDLSTVNHSSCFVDSDFHDFLWTVLDNAE